MDSIGKAMTRVIEKCDVCIDGSVISKEFLLQTFSEFISDTIESEKHNVGIILHTGSICFDAILLAYAALSNILYNKTTAIDIVHSLQLGDMVLLYNSNGKASKWIFKGFVNDIGGVPQEDQGKYILLYNEKDKCSNHLPETGWGKIVPYFGESKAMDGRGLRHENEKRKDFFKVVLEKKETEIPRTTDTSTVIVMSRDKADKLVKGLSFRYDKKDIKLTELVPTAYFTEKNQSYQYGENPAKNEPVIKLTGKVSVARALLFSREGNKNIGLMVFGEDSYRRGETELPELINRQSIQYVYLSMNIDSEVSANLVADYEEAKLFACTKDFLLLNSYPMVEVNPYTKRMTAQADAIIDKEVETTPVSGFIDWEKYKSFKKSIFFIKSSDYDSDEECEFIMQAFSLMNLFISAVFPIGLLEELIDKGDIYNTEKPELRLDKLEKTAKMLPVFLKESANNVVGILTDLYLELHDGTPKAAAFLGILKNNRKKKIAIVVPKAYFTAVIDRYMSMHGINVSNNICIFTANRFDNTQLYDLIIVVGNISGKRFDALRCRASQKINILLYESEKYSYEKSVRDAKTAEHSLNKRSVNFVEDEYTEETINVDEKELLEISMIDNEVSAYIKSVPLKAIEYNLRETVGKNTAEIVAIAKFDSDEVAFFTKNYKAYKLNEESNSVNEVGVSNLEEGDIIVFTRSTSETRDIVEELLQEMIKNKSFSPEVEVAYYKSREWKNILINYMKQTGSSEKTIADEMISNGVGVQEITIRGWLDEESHIVRPQKLDSIQQIALIAGNTELFDNAEDCFKAGTYIYNIRRRILEAIGQAILGEITGNTDVYDSMTKSIADRIKDIAVTLQIESIMFINKEVPINKINRPIVIED